MLSFCFDMSIDEDKRKEIESEEKYRAKVRRELEREDQEDRAANEPNMWAVIRDITFFAIGKGQLLLFIFGTTLIILAWRIPGDNLAEIVNRILDGMINRSLIGYVIAGAVLLGWIAQANFQRRVFQREMARVSKERNQLQEQLEVPVQSSQS